MSIATGFCAASILTMMQTLAGHTLKLALIKPAASADYGMATASYATLTGNGDEISGTGYTAGGVTLAGLTVAQGGTTNAITYLTFTAPAWAASSFSARGALIYDTSNGNKAVATIDFGETKTVLAGTFTINLPAADFVNAALRLSI